MNVQKLRSKNYRKVIQVNVPTRFYWDDDGFDGIEFGPFKDITRYQERLIFDILLALPAVEPIVPDAFTRAFEGN